MCPGEFCPDSKTTRTRLYVMASIGETRLVSYYFYTHLFKPDSVQGYAKLLHLMSLVWSGLLLLMFLFMPSSCYLVTWDDNDEFSVFYSWYIEINRVVTEHVIYKWVVFQSTLASVSCFHLMEYHLALIP